MSTVTGTSGTVKKGVAAIAAIISFSHDRQAETVEDSVLGQTAKTFKPDRTSHSGAMSCQWDKADTTGQETLIEGAEVTLILQPEGDVSGDKTITGTFIITSVGLAVSAGAMVTRDYAFQGTGAYTEGAVV